MEQDTQNIQNTQDARVRLEVAVQDWAGARLAREAGADRIELCMALGATGGLTPSQALIRLTSQVELPLGVQVLIRPRGGDFVYTADEQEVQVLDARLAIRAGASGIVVGALERGGQIDRDFAQRMAEVAQQESERQGRHIDLTFHRAFDAARDREAALETLIALGYDRVLTSGGAPTVGEGLESLQQLAGQAQGRIQIMAGGGLKPEGIGHAVAAGVNAVHLSARKVLTSSGGPGGGGEASQIESTDQAVVAAAAAALQSALA
ncbi:copper homeostasis protein CutC [Bombiscardovia apis]|uniref:PF03932 family protein CutC n=1 Tax=Bombiscardovia apis TaxID=2932182 RepID=A0ABM8BC41_9BIFI|nr:copper homeostasis protein CutC [Bombiscardovia apis]BDR54410.1 copper homeostasis protein CutC [Bombiscardovia apis]